MKKKVNTKLLKSIIETDFLLFTGTMNMNLKTLKSCNNLNSGKDVIYTLEAFELIKTLKQFVRFLQFLNNHQSKCLHICSSSKQILGFLNKYMDPAKTKISQNMKQIGP